jgi:hypothetical protein
VFLLPGNAGGFGGLPFPVSGPAAEASGSHPTDIGGLTSFGISLVAIAQNAVNCSAAGKTAADVDFGDFLKGDGSSTVPQCLFGMPVSRGI